MLPRGREDPQVRHAEINRADAVVLDPLAKILVGVLMPVMVGLSQGMVDLQRRRKGRERQQNQRQGACQRHGEAGGPGNRR